MNRKQLLNHYQHFCLLSYLARKKQRITVCSEESKERIREQILLEAEVNESITVQRSWFACGLAEWFEDEGYYLHPLPDFYLEIIAETEGLLVADAYTNIILQVRKDK